MTSIMIAKSLTDELIEKQKIDKWNGDVPMVQSGSLVPMINMDGNLNFENNE